MIRKELLDKLHKNFNIKLNEQQQSAAFHVDGPAIVLAVPGAGKTTTMVVRIHNLINTNGITPENILTMTFSKASARDMQNRYIKLFGLREGKGLLFSTIHSFALSVIRNYERNNSLKYQIIEGNMDSTAKLNKVTILKGLFKDINKRYITEDEMEQLTNEMGLVKNRGIDKGDFKKYNFDTLNFSDIFSRYETYKRANNYIDFDDMLTFARDILSENRKILSYYQQQYKYVLVDEGQDTSPIQHELIKILVSPSNNIFLVADDDQSIYGFRGADPKELKEFSQNYPGAKKYFIENNYRSSKNIVNVANDFIKTNYDRELKNMVTDNEIHEPVELKNFINEEEQLAYLYEFLKKKHIRGSVSTAILYRNNISAMLLIDELERRSVEFSIRDNKQHFLKHWFVLDFICYINFSIDNSDLFSFEKIYYRMEAYLPKVALDKLKVKYKPGENILAILQDYCGLGREQILKVKELQVKFETLCTLAPTSAIEYINSVFGYGLYVKKYCKDNNVSENNTDEMLFILKRIASYTQSNVQFLCRMEELEKIVENAMYKNNKPITLSTIHGVKGLEFDNVVIIDLIEGKIPSRESIKRYEDDKDIALLSEEARLFYVGVTRARKGLLLSTISYKNGKKVNPSRYFKRVYEILHPGEKFNEETTENSINLGDKVNHIVYGEGEVIAVEEDKINVKFLSGKDSLFPIGTIGKYLFVID